jgi:hypothetical protein
VSVRGLPGHRAERNQPRESAVADLLVFAIPAGHGQPNLEVNLGIARWPSDAVYTAERRQISFAYRQTRHCRRSVVPEGAEVTVALVNVRLTSFSQDVWASAAQGKTAIRVRTAKQVDSAIRRFKMNSSSANYLSDYVSFDCFKTYNQQPHPDTITRLFPHHGVREFFKKGKRASNEENFAWGCPEKGSGFLRVDC